ncbi:hypothetical protein SAMN05421799_103111 [Alicyclobacillus vulcanalis]|uniref:Uncharacterized protein n=1 Tax=Alicyclobacillus vulcanalis TaxID=252246 RepID=A0A1N7LFJ8_9BACL|nr:hypothetical protein SAMN05421799_103111 [Alicyclobacillus vulcanalis]
MRIPRKRVRFQFQLWNGRARRADVDRRAAIL